MPSYDIPLVYTSLIPLSTICKITFNMFFFIKLLDLFLTPGILYIKDLNLNIILFFFFNFNFLTYFFKGVRVYWCLKFRTPLESLSLNKNNIIKHFGLMVFIRVDDRVISIYLWIITLCESLSFERLQRIPFNSTFFILPPPSFSLWPFVNPLNNLISESK